MEGAGVAVGPAVEGAGVGTLIDTVGDVVVALVEGTTGIIKMGKLGEEEEGRVVGTE